MRPPTLIRGALLCLSFGAMAFAMPDGPALTILGNELALRRDTLVQQGDLDRDGRRQVRALESGLKKIGKSSGSLEDDVKALRKAAQRVVSRFRTDDRMVGVLFVCAGTVFESVEIDVASVQAFWDPIQERWSTEDARAVAKLDGARADLAAGRAALTQNENVNDWHSLSKGGGGPPAYAGLKPGLKRLERAVRRSRKARSRALAQGWDPSASCTVQAIDAGEEITFTTGAAFAEGPEPVHVSAGTGGSAHVESGSAGDVLVVRIAGDLCLGIRVDADSQTGEFTGDHDAGSPGDRARVAVFSAYLDVVFDSSLVAAVSIDSFDPQGTVVGTLVIPPSQPGFPTRTIDFELELELELDVD